MTAIQIKFPALTFKAGQRALLRIRQQGLKPADVGILPGAAGGPKALGIQGLDLALFGDWLPRAPRERALLGALPAPAFPMPPPGFAAWANSTARSASAKTRAWRRSVSAAG